MVTTDQALKNSLGAVDTKLSRLLYILMATNNNIKSYHYLSVLMGRAARICQTNLQIATGGGKSGFESLPDGFEGTITPSSHFEAWSKHVLSANAVPHYLSCRNKRR